MSPKFSKTTSDKPEPPAFDWQAKVKQPILVIGWVALSFGLANGLVYLLALAMGGLGWLKTINPTILTFIASVMIYALALVILIAVPRLLQVKFPKFKQLVATPLEFGLDGLPTWRQLGLGVAGFIASMVLMVVVTMLVMAIVPGFNINQAQDVGFTKGNFYYRHEMLMIFASLVVLAPIVEELLFRGYLYSKLRRDWSMWVTTLAVSLLFGLAHGQANVAVLTASLSLVMCVTRDWSDTIYPSVIIHMLKNGLSFYLIFVLGVGA